MSMHTYFDKVSSFGAILPLRITSLGIVLSLLVSHVNILLRISFLSKYPGKGNIPVASIACILHLIVDSTLNIVQIFPLNELFCLGNEQNRTIRDKKRLDTIFFFFSLYLRIFSGTKKGN